MEVEARFDWDEVAGVLDGGVESRETGFDCETESRVLFGPYTMAADAAAALAICRERGLLKEKLARMELGAAHLLYDTTLPPPDKPS